MAVLSSPVVTAVAEKAVAEKTGAALARKDG
jgi:hypothetical protein